MISLRMGRKCEPWQGSTYFRPFDDLYTAVVVVDIWEEDMGDIYDIPVVAVYNWLGAEKATMEDLTEMSFLRGDDWFRETEEHKRYLHSVGYPEWIDRLYYDLEKIGHLGALPAFPSEEWAYKKKPVRWGTINSMLAENWLLEGKEIPHRPTWGDPEAERERAWKRAQSYFKKHPDLLERMRVFLFEGEAPEELKRKQQEEWERVKERYSDPIHQKRMWKAIFGTRMPKGI